METLKLLVAGDMCIIGKPSEMILKGKGQEILEDIKKELYDKDISLVNVEMPFTETDEKIRKSGPNLKTSPKCAQFVKDCGFDIACLANNHIGDYGPDAVLETINCLEDSKIKTAGAGKNLSCANKIVYVEKNNIKVAVLNYAEHEFGTATKTEAGSAPLEVFDIIAKIKEANLNADQTIVIIHGGNEYNPLPSPRMVKTYRGFVDAGASAVINIHTHCPQGYELYNGAPICYCPGNFLFDLSPNIDKGMWTEGYLIRLTFSKDSFISFEPVPYTFAPKAEKIILYKGEEKEKFVQYINYLSNLLKDEDLLDKYWRAWCKVIGENLIKYAKSGDFKNGIADPNVLAQRNLFTCEAHHELLSTYTKAFCDNNLDGLEEYWNAIEQLQQFKIKL